MDRIGLFLRRLRSFNSRLGTIIGLCSLLLGAILAFWPNLLRTDNTVINLEKYECIKSQLSPEATTFLIPYLNKSIPDLKFFYKSIPASISQKETNLLVDLIHSEHDYTSINHFLLLIILFLLLAGFIYREFTSGRKYRIAHSISYLHNAIHIIRDNWQKIFPERNGKKDLDKENAKEYIQKSLGEFENFFSTVTGSPCRTCIKAIVGFSPLKVETFARSTSSACLTANEDTDNDKVDNNSEFYELVANRERFWHVEDVDSEKNYQNSHLEINSKKKKSKQLGYKTTFTWPIRKIKHGQSGNDDELEIYGFLCVDSKVSGVFKERYDFDSGALIADFYYFLLRVYVLISANKLEEQSGNGRQ